MSVDHGFQPGGTEVSIRGQVLVMLGELNGTLASMDARMTAHDERLTKVLEDHEKRLKAGETFRARVKGACGAFVALGGAGATAWWKSHGF